MDMIAGQGGEVRRPRQMSVGLLGQAAQQAQAFPIALARSVDIAEVNPSQHQRPLADDDLECCGEFDGPAVPAQVERNQQHNERGDESFPEATMKHLIIGVLFAGAAFFQFTRKPSPSTVLERL
jgi:hypothetical protein